MTLYLDTETTGLSPRTGDTIVEVAIVDSEGRTVIDTLVNPGQSIPWRASQVHGINDSMVRGKPTLDQLMPRILQALTNQTVVIYNAPFDAPFFPGQLKEARSVECAMRRFTEALGGGKWRKLDVAAQHVGHTWTGTAHRALADTLACRSVWSWLEQQSRGSAAAKASASPRSQRAGDQSIIECPKCSQRLRVPAGQLLDITCATCSKKFRQQT